MKMWNRYQISKEELAEIEKARQKTMDKNVDRRLKALLLHAEGVKHEAIAEKTDFSKTYISKLVSKYREHGLSALVDNHYQGNHRNLSLDEEADLLEPFKQAAEAGQVVEVSEIKKVYEKAVGRSLEKDHGIIYRVLARHGWRKVMPRSKHPNKASDEDIESSKKLTPLSGTSWKILQTEESG
jgi:transposase